MSLKLRRAARLSPLSRYPRTWAALMQRIPASAHASLTGRQIAELAAAMHAQWEAGHSAGYRDAQ